MSPIKLKRTNATDPDFIKLILQLDQDLAIKNGDNNTFFTAFNKTDNINHVIVAYVNTTAVGCGAIKRYNETSMEIKRMFVLPESRNMGVAKSILIGLQDWTKQLGFTKCILETGDKMTEAINLYKKNNFKVIDNYEPYINVKDSICFEKQIL